MGYWLSDGKQALPRAKKQPRKDQLYELDYDSFQFIRYNEIFAFHEPKRELQSSLEWNETSFFYREYLYSQTIPREQFKEFLISTYPFIFHR